MLLPLRCWAALALLSCAVGAASDEDLAEADDARWAAFAQPGYHHGAAPHGDSPMVVVLALKQRNLDFLEERARYITDPVGPEYAQYYTREVLASISGPADHDVNVVSDWLEGSGGQLTYNHGRDLARFRCSVRCVEKAFGTKLLVQRGRLKPGQSRFRAATPITLPKRVSKVLDGVSLNAPIFMPPRPAQEEPGKFIYPLEGRIAPRFHPFAIAGDQFLTLRFVAFCKNGKANDRAVDEGICAGPVSGEQPLNMAARNQIISFEILVMQEPQMQKTILLPAAVGVLGERPGKCALAHLGKDNELDFDHEDVKCVEFNVTLTAIQNFAKTTARIRAHFGDGSVSPFSPVAELPTVWPNPYTVPSLLSKTYGVPLNKPITHPRNAISVVEFLGQYYNPEDLETFFQLMGVMSWKTPGRTNPVLLGRDLPIAGSVLGGEAQLDLQYIMALAANVSTWFWSVPGTEIETQQEPFLDWLMQLSDTPDDIIPLVHSVSYGDDELSMPAWFKRRVNAEFMKLAMRGISVLVASGDDGASGYKVSQIGAEFCNRSRPEFPTTSPWVTSVGGTQLAVVASPICAYYTDYVIVNCQQPGEVVCSSSLGGGITSGGGFSDIFEQPWYQKEAVESYLKQTDIPVPAENGTWTCNVKGRAYPDVSALASNYLVWMGDRMVAESGTSASTPVLAAMVAHWNEARLQEGRPPLGFLNPLLYRLGRLHPEAFNDVIMGDNRCSQRACCDNGFYASRGWDAVSGFGSPKFDVLLDLLKSNELSSGPAVRYVPGGFESIPNAQWGAALRDAAEPTERGLWHQYGAAVNAVTVLGLVAMGSLIGSVAARGDRSLRWWAAPARLRADLLTSS